MSSIELIKKAFRLEKTERIPWVPFVGCHAASLLNITAKEYLQSADKMVSGLSKAIDLYNPDGIPVMFDLQVEAEAMGCKLQWADENPPAVVSHILTEKKLDELKIPTAKDGRIPLILETTRQLREKYPEIALYGLITGPFTLALHLLGTDIFLKMLEAPEEVIEILDFTTKVAKKMAAFYIDAGCDIIAVVDPMTSQIDPDSFTNFLHKPESEVFSFIRDKKALSSFFVCGHAQQNIEAMCACKPDNISIDENIPLEFVRDIALSNNISFGGNMKLTMVLLMGSIDDVNQEVIECIDRAGEKGFILAPGCDIPMLTPAENLQPISQLIHDPYQQDIIRALEKKEQNLALLNMKDYGLSDKVIIDIITLDSESCAPCQYMVEAVKRVAPEFEGIVEWREHAIKHLEAVTFMNSLMVRNIPTICIDGKMTFISQIPSHHALIAAIQQRINEKLRLKISRKKATILVFGSDKDECEAMKKNIDQAIQETGKTIEVSYSHAKKDLESYGIVQAPAVIIANYKIKSQGDIPKIEIIREWLKDMS